MNHKPGIWTTINVHHFIFEFCISNIKMIVGFWIKALSQLTTWRHPTTPHPPPSFPPSPSQKWPNWVIVPKSCAMFWKSWKNNFHTFSFSDMIDFVLKLGKLTKMSPYMSKLLSFAQISLAIRTKCISEDSNKMKNLLRIFFFKPFFLCLEPSETYTKKKMSLKSE